MNLIANDTNTSVVFESGRRIQIFLRNLIELVSKREVFIAREMTKLYETFYWGEISQVLEEISTKDYSLKGEFVIVIKGRIETPDPNFIDKDQERILKILLENMKKKEALLIASKIFGVSKNSIYKRLLKEK
tara:strand:- start:523 stop:918 length:396 start_codon:yes stop_codon:yes gene_type:complete